MPQAARGNGVDTVKSDTGSGSNCASSMVTATDECSDNVLINGNGSVRIGDYVAVHVKSGCGLESPPLSVGSSDVFINGQGAGRLGDNYIGDGNNKITSGSPNVFING